LYKTSLQFRMHSQNVAEIRKGLTQIERGHKQAIRQAQAPAVAIYRRLHSLMIGILAEATLRKIVTDPNGFNDTERDLIWRNGSQVSRWLMTVELAYRRHYGVLVHRPLDAQSLGASNSDRYSEVRTLLSGDLAPVIEDRNKTAHGQWVWHLKSRQENVFKENSAPEPANYVVLAAQERLITAISELVYVLAVSEKTFARDYKLLLARIASAQAQLDGSGYAAFTAGLRPSPGRRDTNGKGRSAEQV
jgi:hypothetical protein